jgi:hypothetical protein
VDFSTGARVFCVKKVKPNTAPTTMAMTMAD